MIDGATEAAMKEQELVYAQCASMGVQEVSLVGIESVEKGDAVTIFKAVKELFEGNVAMAANNTCILEKTVSFASDCASVMCGKKLGLVTRFREEQPRLVGILCVAHRLELSYKDVFKQGAQEL